MHLNDAHKMIADEMRAHGLLAEGWTWKWDRSKRRFGLCNYSDMRLQFSKELWMVNDRERCSLNLRHEIAHALAGYHAAHGPRWQRIVREIGGRPQAKYTLADTITPPARWIGTCPTPSCDNKVERHRKSDKMFGQACGRCCGPRFDPRFKFVWRENVGVVSSR